MSNERVVFSTALSTHIQRGIPQFEAGDAAFKTELARKYESRLGRVGACRIHPSIMKFCADYWDDQSRQLQFETKQSYDACSREVARRTPWVYFSSGAVGDFEGRYDIDIAGSGSGDDE